MTPETMQRMLAVTLRLAAAPAVAACGTAAPQPGGNVVKPAVVEPVASDGVRPPADCATIVPAAVSKAFPDGVEWFDQKSWGTVNAPDAMACCAKLRADNPDGQDWQAVEWYRKQGCCEVAVEPPTDLATAFCTPWGPPMPTALA